MNKDFRELGNLINSIGEPTDFHNPEGRETEEYFMSDEAEAIKINEMQDRIDVDCYQKELR